MKKPYFLFSLLFFVFSINGLSQEAFQLLFKSNSFQISPENEKVLHEKVVLFKNEFSNNYKIEIVGHTDDVGTSFFNKTLSIKRAKAVADFFNSNGVPNYKISTSGVGFSIPAVENTSEEGKQKNRRVEVRFIYENEINLVSLKKFKKKPTSYFFDNQSEKILQYISGSNLVIPKNAFVDENGKDVEGEIEIRYQEFRKPLDFILSGIPMHIDKGGKRSFFNSGGMFKIEAFQNGKPIFLKSTKEIVMDFKLTERLPNMNFFALDSVANNWQELAKVTDENGDQLFRYLVCGSYQEEEKKCKLNLCESLKYIQEKGIEYAESEILLSDLSNLTNPGNYNRIQEALEQNKLRIASNTNRIITYNLKASQNKMRFVLEKTYDNKEETTFKIDVERATFKENRKFSKFNWKIPNDDINTKTNIFFQKWMTCLVEKGKNNKYVLILKDTTQQVILEDVVLDVSRRIQRKKQGKFLTALVDDFNTPSTSLLKSDSIKNKLIDENTKLQRKQRLFSSYRLGNLNPEENKKIKDSVECFYQYSLEIKPMDEKPMDFETWIAYFDSNKEMMLTRYTNLSENEKYKICIEAELERERERLRNLELVKQLATTANRKDDLMQKISITNLGVYNFDVVIDSEYPDVFLAEYRYKNKRIEPSFIFVVNDRINGVFRFDKDGKEYNPGKFRCYSNAKNTILVFDTNGETYLFSAKKFANLKRDYFSEKQVLNIEKIKNVQMLENEF